MAVNFHSEQITFSAILKKFKRIISIGIFLIFFFSFLMVKTYSRKGGDLQELTYLLSIKDQLSSGRIIEMDKVWKTLSSYKELRPEFDRYFLEKKLKENNWSGALDLLSDVRSRLVVQSDHIKKFSNSSLDILSNNSGKAYEGLNQTDHDVSNQETKPILYIFTLYRKMYLEKILDKKDEYKITKDSLIKFLDAKKDSNLLKTGIAKKIYEEII